MIRRTRFWLGLALLAATSALVIGPANPRRPSRSTRRRTSKDCSFCHVPPGYNLNDAGKYYEEHQHSLKGYDARRQAGRLSPVILERTEITKNTRQEGTCSPL